MNGMYAGSSISVEVQGLKELEKKLMAMGSKVALHAIRNALVSGARIIKQEAITRAPMRTGNLRRAILIKRMPKGNPFKENVIIGVRHGRKVWRKTGSLNGKTTYDKSRDAFYWTFLEFGHMTRPKGKARTHTERASAMSSGTVKKISATPFIQPAFTSKQNMALGRIKEVLQSKIAQYAKEPA